LDSFFNILKLFVSLFEGFDLLAYLEVGILAYLKGSLKSRFLTSFGSSPTFKKGISL